MAITAGMELGPYTIVESIGSGGMGQVYRARDRRLERDIAIKVLPDTLSKDPEVLSRFEREAKILATLSHPNILAVYDVGTHNGVRYVVTELLEGATLRDRISRAPLPWKKALELSISIAEGLSAAHARGVIHRDLKPENIFITSEGHVKILDFGLARAAASADLPNHSTDTNPGTILGTVEYMSPEQVRSTGIDVRSDLFSFGCVLYEMVSGVRPFTRKTAADTMAAILKEEAQSLTDAGIPLELDRIILHCLEKNPEQRFQTARDLAFDLRSIWHDSGIIRTAVVQPKGKALRLWIPAVIVLLCLAGVLAYLYSRRPTGVQSLAVLPFANSSADPEAEYLSDGITEGIINRLSRLPGLKVMARSTVFRYKSKDTDPQEAGTHLKVNAVLTGRIQKQSGRLIIKTELVRVEDGTQLWGESYTRKITEVQDAEQAIATQIAESLRLKLSGEDLKRTVQQSESGEAYQSYLKGRYYWNKRTPEDMQRAIAFFEQSTDKDPSFALAYAGLADSFNLLTDYTGVPPQEAYPRARAAAQKALELDDQLAEAHASLAHTMSVYDWDWSGAEKQYVRALELNPNYATAHHWLGWHLAMQGRHNEAQEQIKKAQELDPLSPVIQANAGLFSFFARNYDPCVEKCKSILSVDPTAGFAHYYMGLALEQKGNLDAAVREFQAAIQGDPDGAGNVSALARALILQGKQEEAAVLIAKLQEASQQRYLSPVYFARIHSAMGDADLVMKDLEKGLALRDELMIWLKVDPRFDRFRSDQRFQQVLKKIFGPNNL